MIKRKTFVLISLIIFLISFPVFSDENKSEETEETIVYIESAKKTEYKKIEEEEVVIFTGDVKLSVSKPSQEIYIEADNVTFNRSRSTIYAEGNVIFTEVGKGKDDSQESLTASSLLFNTETMEGVFDSARVVQESSKNINLTNGATLIVSSELFGKENSGTITFKNGVLTFCDDENPHWKIKASRIWLLPGNEFSFFNALLYVGNLPIFYMPFFYYPKDEMIFNPVFGYRPREGYFVQTTTYLVGRKSLDTLENDDEDAGLFDFMKNTELVVQEREGLFLKNTDEKASMPKNSLKLMGDLYSNLGGMVGIEGKFIDIGPISKLDFSTYLGFSNTLFPINNNVFSKYSVTGNTYYDFSYLFGLNIPFRFLGNLSLNIQKSPFSLSINLPLISDAWFKNDFLNRSENMDWISFLLEDSIVENTGTGEANSYSWNILGSISTPKFIENLAPYVKSFSITSLSSTVNFLSKTDENIDDEIKHYSPERKFYYPASIYPLKMDINISGEIFSFSDKKTSVSSNQETEKDSPLKDIINPIIIEDVENSEFLAEETSFLEDDFLPKIDVSKLDVKNITNYDYKLSYSLKPKFSSEINYFTDDYNSPKDIEISKIKSSFINLKLPFSLNSNLSMKNRFLSLQNNIDVKPILQQHPSFNEEYEEKNLDTVNKIKLSDYETTKLEIINSNTVSFSPSVFLSDKFSFNLNWKSSITLLKSKFIGTIEDPDWEYSSVQWDSESITQNNLSATFSSKQFENKISETIEFTAHLPPLTSSFSGKLNLSFPFCTNFGMFLEYKQKSKTDLNWIFSPLTQNSTWSFFDNKLTFTQNLKFNLEENRFDTLSFSLKGFGLSASYLMSYTNPYVFSSTEGTWNIVSEKEFLPYEFRLSYVMPSISYNFFSDKVTFSPTLSSEIKFDLIQFTGCYFSISPGFTFKITDSLSISFSSVSRNDVIYRYVQNWFDTPIEIPGETNFFVDLFNSFTFWDSNLRKASGFKLKKLSLSINHDLHDWTLSSTLSLEPRLIQSSRPYRYDFSPYFTLAVAWKPMSSMKTTIEDKYGEFLLY